MSSIPDDRYQKQFLNIFLNFYQFFCVYVSLSYFDILISPVVQRTQWHNDPTGNEHIPPQLTTRFYQINTTS